MGSILPSSATGGRLPWSIRARGSSGGAFRASTATRSSAACWPASEEKGFSDVVLDDMAEYQSEYVRNTAIVSTLLTDRQGGKVGSPISSRASASSAACSVRRRSFASSSRCAGLPRITIRMRPTSDYGKPLAQRSLGSNHIRYSGERHRDPPDHRRAAVLIDSEAPFVLTRPLHLVFGAGRAVPRRSAIDLPRLRRPHARLLDGMGAPAVDLLRMAGGDHPRRHHA